MAAEPVTEALKAHRGDRIPRPDELVFKTKAGGPLSQRNATRAIRTAAKAAGLPDQTGWHDLRHTCISRWVRAGFDIYLVSRWAGHANASTTLNICSHLIPGQQEDIRAKIAAAFGGPA